MLAPTPHPSASLTLEGGDAAYDEVFELKAVGSNVLQGLPPHCQLVAVLHLACAAGGALVFADLQVGIWGNKGTVGH